MTPCHSSGREPRLGQDGHRLRSFFWPVVQNGPVLRPPRAIHGQFNQVVLGASTKRAETDLCIRGDDSPNVLVTRNRPKHVHRPSRANEGPGSRPLAGPPSEVVEGWAL